MSNCISCNEAPPPCACSSSQTCVQTQRNCTTCPQNICISLSDSSHHSPSAGLGGIVGGVIGATTAAILITLSLWILYKRNYLPSCLYPTNRSNRNLTLHKFHRSPSNSTTTTTTTSKNKSIFSRQLSNNNPTHPTHQSVIFLPTDDIRDPKSSPLESDDDPFSDVHSGVSIISPRPYSNQASPYPPGQFVSFLLFFVLPMLTMSTTDDREGLPKPSTLPDQNPLSPSTQPPTTPSPIIVGLPVPPPPTGNPSNAFKPLRPLRAPDLDLRLPGAKAGLDADQPSPNKSNHHLRPPSTDPATPTTTSYNSQHHPGSPNDHSQATYESNHSGASDTHSTLTSLHRKRLSGISDAASHDSHLSSILDPAMIVTPVTLVRTASGRQAAVQRVALRGQEKARVVRLPPSSNPKPHVPSPLSLEANHANSLPVESEKFPETFKFTPSINLGLGSSWDPDSPLPQPRGQLLSPSLSHSTFSVSSLSSSLDPFSDSSAVTPTAQANTDSQLYNKNRNSAETHKGSNLNRNRSTAAYSTRSSVGSSSVCESFIMDEDEVEFLTVLGRSAAILAHRQSPSSHQPNIDNPTSVSHHHIHMKALGRDRAISLSSIIGEEAARDSFNSSPPPLPPMPTGSSSPIISRSKSSSSNLPEPFKPFAGQKPSSSTNHRISRSNSNGSGTKVETGTKVDPPPEEETQEKPSRNPEFTKSMLSSTSQLSRVSTVSSIRSGYGSVLEGIPFNIGFNSECDDIFNTSSSRMNLSFSAGSISPMAGPNSVVDSSHSSSVGRFSGLGSAHFSLGADLPTHTHRNSQSNQLDPDDDLVGN